MNRVHVVFGTTQFGETPTGPSTYAHYLWEGFRDDPEVDFHLVAPSFPFEHPKTHPAGASSGSGALYRSICRKVLEVGDRLGESGERVILHLNNSHMGRELCSTRHELWGQINDYENTDCYRRFWWNLRNYGLRRTAALARRRWIESALVRRQDLTLCNSKYTRGRVLDAYRPSRPERVVVLYKAVDLEFFRRPSTLPPDPVERDPETNRILFVGSNFVVKGLDLLVQAFLDLRTPADLTVVGVEEQEFAARCGRLDRRLREQHKPYRFMGRQPRERVRELLWHSDVFALPSRSEGLGVAILEAQAAAVPVVASRLGGIPEIASNHSACRLVSEGDSAELASTLDEACAERVTGDTRQSSGPEAWTISNEGFSAAVMRSRLRNLYLDTTIPAGNGDMARSRI